MASAEVMSACENVCRDASWVLPMVNDLAPIIALAGAVILFYLQRRADRSDELRHIKRKLYSNLLKQLSTAYRDIPNCEGWEQDPRFGRVEELKNEVALLQEQVDLAPHIEKAIEAIRGKNAKDRRGMHDPKGAGGLATSNENAEYVGTTWIFNRDLFDQAMQKLQEFMREDLES